MTPVTGTHSFSGIDYELLDDGTVVITASIFDKAGNQIKSLPAGWSAPSCAISDPSAISIGPTNPPDPRGLSVLGTPLKLATGVIPTFSATAPDGTTTIQSDDSETQPIDVLADPNNPGSFKVAESAPA